MQHNQDKSVQGFVLQPLRAQIHFLFGVFKKILAARKAKARAHRSAKCQGNNEAEFHKKKKTNKKAQSKKESERDRDRLKKGN